MSAMLITRAQSSGSRDDVDGSHEAWLSFLRTFLSTLFLFFARVLPVVVLMFMMSMFITAVLITTSHQSVGSVVRYYSTADEFKAADESQRLGHGSNSEHSQSKPTSFHLHPDPPTLVICTSFDQRPDRPYHAFAHRQAIRNWAHFLPDVQPILFLKSVNSSLAERAQRHGWIVFPVTEYSKYGVPRLKALYYKIRSEYPNATFLGYVNGDIIFDHSLLMTLNAFKTRYLTPLKNNVLIVGQRSDVDINFNNSESVYDIMNMNELKKQSAMSTPLGVDYFFFSRAGLTLNWTSLADVVIGRPAYDNYLVAMSRQQGVNVIDATETLTALHLSTPGVHKEGFTNNDTWYNHDLIGPFDYNAGRTFSCELVTRYDTIGTVYVVKR